MFVEPSAFLAKAEAGGFLEWARFLGHFYGTPIPDPPAGHDVLLEIDVQGVRQVLAGQPDAVVFLVVAPSVDVQARRLRSRGDDEAHVLSRLALGADEEQAARSLATHVVVNDDLDRAVAEVAGIVESYRRHPDGGRPRPGPLRQGQ